MNITKQINHVLLLSISHAAVVDIYSVLTAEMSHTRVLHLLCAALLQQPSANFISNGKTNEHCEH